LREVSSLIVGLWAIHLIGGVVAINRGIDHWTAWLAWHRHPAAVAFTALALIAAVYHAVTWFHLAPAIVRVRLGARRVPRWIIIAAQYGAALVVVALGTWWVLGVAAP
jgi:fumarate reductase subunit C